MASGNVTGPANMKQTVIQRIPTARPGLELPYLPERADRLTSLLGQSAAYITEANSEPRTIYVSSSVSEILGFSPQEVMDGDCVVIHPNDESVLVAGATALAERGLAFSCVARVKLKRGDWRWLEISSLASYITDDGVEIVFNESGNCNFTIGDSKRVRLQIRKICWEMT